MNQMKAIKTTYSQNYSPEAVKGGLAPEVVLTYLNSKGIPIKEEYVELLYLLQVPEIWHHIMAQLAEVAMSQ